jgi:hypothetical protein
MQRKDIIFVYLSQLFLKNILQTGGRMRGSTLNPPGGGLRYAQP